MPAKRTLIRRAMLGGAVLAVAAWIAISLNIGHSVCAAARDAQARYGGSAVTALTRLVDDTQQPRRARDRAVWALGQIGDPAALPGLETHVSGQPCDHTASLCQYELAKAISACHGGVNIAALVWRRFYTT